MGERTRSRPAYIVMFLAVLVVLGALPVIAAAPQPVVPVSGPDQPSDPPAEDEAPPNLDCPGGSARARSDGVQLMVGPVLPRQGTTYPGPVVPVKPLPPAPPKTDCLAQLSLTLKVKSPNSREPDGADGSLDELAIPRSALESGFDINLPAQSRVITLTDPGKDWELASTSCTCGGGTAAMSGALLVSGGLDGGIGTGVRTTQPGPVIPVLGGPRSGGCVGPSVTKQSASAAGPVPSMAQPGELTTYPGPVVPVQPGPALLVPEETFQPATVSWDRSGTVNIDDPEGSGGVFACVWTVELINGDFELKTVTKPPGREDRFKYLVSPTGLNALKATPKTMRGAPPANKEALRRGPWSVELTNLGKSWKVKRSSCSESDTTTTSTASGASATLGVEPDDKVRCTFELKLLSPREGRWRAVNGAGVVDCGPVSFDLPKVTDLATIKVRQDGDRLIARGLTSGGTSWTLNRGADDSLRYTGTMRMTQAGAKGKFTTKLDLIDEEHMKGTLTGNVKMRGQSCAFKRPLNVSYAGG